MPVMQILVERIVKWRERNNNKECFNTSYLPKLKQLYAETQNSEEGQEEELPDAGRGMEEMAHNGAGSTE